jgi:hypothetical protein
VSFSFIGFFSLIGHEKASLESHPKFSKAHSGLLLKRKIAAITRKLGKNSFPALGGRGYFLMEHEKSPRQLDHASSNPSVA